MRRSFIKGLKHAFAVGPDPNRDPEASLPEVLERAADTVAARGLEMPAVFLLETLSPLNFLASQAASAFLPLLSGFMNTSELEEAALALEDRSTVRRLIERIEQLSRESSPC